MRIEVIFALADRQDIAIVELAEGAVAGQAIAASGMFERHGLSAARVQLGIFGRIVSPEGRLHDGDRIEILRPLAMDPKEARRRRARRTRV